MPKKLFITISPPNRTLRYSLLKFKNPLHCVFLDDSAVINNAFSRYRIKQYVFYPELDKKGRLHYHGRATLSPSQYVSFYKSIKPKLERSIGFVDISPVEHELENLLYCMKEWGKTKEILDVSQPIGPLFLLHTVGGRKGFKCRDGHCDKSLDLSSLTIVDYLEGLSLNST